MRVGGLVARLVRLLARWLHSLAARLERYVRPAPAPATLSALADRFPGAPEHWLRDIAEHVDGFDTLAADEAAPPEPEPEEETSNRPAIVPRARALPHRPRPELRIAPQRQDRRVEARAKRPAHASRPALRWLSAARPTREMAEVDVTAHRSAAPVLSGAAPAAAPRRWLKWIGRIAGRRAVHPIEAVPARAREASVDAAILQPQAPRLFTVAKGAPRRRNPFMGSRAEAAGRSPLEWPEPVASPIGRDLRFESGSAGRPVQAWTAAAEGSWPALPDAGQTIADAAPAARPLHDFNREQMAGLWSA